MNSATTERSEGVYSKVLELLRLEASAIECAAMNLDRDAVLTALSVKRLVVGHTVQKSGVSSACDERVFRVDVGLSDYYGQNPTQVLEIRASGVKVLGAD